MNLRGFLSEIHLHYSTVNPQNFPKKSTKNLWGFPVKSALEYPLKICNLSLLKLPEFPSHLSGRSYKVKIGNSLSESVACEVGVPQGSVLGPILFNCITARLPQILRSMAIGCHSSEGNNSINNETVARKRITRAISAISSFMHDDHLKLNPSKTLFIPFFRKDSPSD